MSFLSDRVQQIKPSVTLATTQKAKELRAAGEEVFNLAGGEPDFPVPEVARAAAKKAIDLGYVRYTAVDGIPELKQAIIKKFARDNNLAFALDQVIVTVGAKQALFNAFIATLNPGDEVVITAPYWVSYPDMVKLAGGKPVIVECKFERDLKLTAEQLSKAITSKTKWLILNSPNNPCGSVYSKEELQDLGKVLEQHPHVHIISDDIYEHIIFDDRNFDTMAAVYPAIADRVLTINGVSKVYAMTGWRIGYAAGPPALIKAMKTIQSQSTSNPSAIAQAASVAALCGPQDFLQEWKRDYQNRRDLVVERLDLISGLKCFNPQGAFYVYVNCEGTIGKQTADGKVINNDLEFAAYLLESYGVATVPGSAFGLSPYLRISFATAKQELLDACEQIRSAVTDLR